MFFQDIGPSSSAEYNYGMSCGSKAASCSDEEQPILAEETSRPQKVPRDEAPRVPRCPSEELRQVGVQRTYPTAEMAARAHDHDVAAIALRGRSACLNFADSAWLLPVPASTEAKDIQKAAAEAAESFRPRSNEEVSAGDGAADVESWNHDAFFMDDEAVFGMPELLAEGLMLPPPQYTEDFDVDADVSLWSYSF